jgi:hypothetical protein
MPYYDTIEEDLTRAREILEKGKADIPEGVAPEIFGVHAMGGTIYGADTFAAYKLLESFVEEIEKLQKLTGPEPCAICFKCRKEIPIKTVPVLCPNCWPQEP